MEIKNCHTFIKFIWVSSFWLPWLPDMEVIFNTNCYKSKFFHRVKYRYVNFRQHMSLNTMSRRSNRTWIFNAISHGSFFVFDGLMWEMVVCFVDFGRIVDHHCLNFPFITLLENFFIERYSIDYIFAEDLVYNLHRLWV
jgi:hypothetical protein